MGKNFERAHSAVGLSVGVKYPALSLASILRFISNLALISSHCIHLLLYTAYGTTAESNSSWEWVEKKIFG